MDIVDIPHEITPRNCDDGPCRDVDVDSATPTEIRYISLGDSTFRTSTSPGVRSAGMSSTTSPPPPRMSSPGPSIVSTVTLQPPPRRPHGARRRGMTPGLFIANPDNSDEEPGQPGSPGSQRSPVTASSSSSGQRLPRNGSGNLHGEGPSSIPIPQIGGGSPRGHIPSIPAPQSSPLPFISPMPSPLPIPSSQVPPLPPPQPERHMRRAQTTPVSDAGTPGHQQRPSLGSLPFSHHPPSSPNRALPPLPSPPINRNRIPSPHSPSPPIPTPSSSQFNSYAPRVSSPEDVTSPNGQNDPARTRSSLSSTLDSRARSGSVQNLKIRVQATIDNESFTTVDITGMQSADGIKDRVFSKVRLLHRAPQLTSD